MKIAVDAMGGDHAPIEVVKGAVEAAEEYGLSIILVGDSERVEPELDKYGTRNPKIEVKHAPEVVEMHEHPANAIRRKQRSSIVITSELVKVGEAQAMVSAGNSGAAMAVAMLKLGRIRGIDRPAIMTPLPSAKGRVVMLDAGANVDCSVENLLQFAIMGREYAEHVMKIPSPRIGLLSIGEEASKGNELTKAANIKLAESGLNFIGNVEGRDIPRGTADVVVCDGFDGNIVLKVAEGTAEFMIGTITKEIDRSVLSRIGAMFIRPALARTKATLDYAEYGGVPLLGVNGVCIICHGRSQAKAIKNAIRAAADAAENEIVKYIGASMNGIAATVT